MRPPGTRLLLKAGMITLIGGCGAAIPISHLAPAARAQSGPIVALGDSLTYGYGNGVTLAPLGPPQAHSYPWDMAADLGITTINAGISGTTAASVLNPSSLPCCPRPVEYQLPALLAQHPRIMVVGFGTNEAANYRHPIVQTIADLHALLDQIAAAGVPIVLWSVHVDCTVMPCATPAPGETAQVYTADWDTALTGLAAQYHAGLVLDAEHGFLPADMTDWIHCDAAGYQKVATLIEAAVRARLGS